MEEKKQAHDHKDCRNLLGSLSEYVDGELSEELCDLLEQHMVDCENCRVVVDTLKKTVDIYHFTGSDDLPGDVRQRLFKSLDIEKFIE